MSPHKWAVATLPLAFRDNGLPTCTTSGGDVGCTAPNITKFTDDWNSLSAGAQAGIIIGAGAGGALILGAIAFLVFRCCRRKGQGETAAFFIVLNPKIHDTEPFLSLVMMDRLACCKSQCTLNRQKLANPGDIEVSRRNSGSGNSSASSSDEITLCSKASSVECNPCDHSFLGTCVFSTAIIWR